MSHVGGSTKSHQQLSEPSRLPLQWRRDIVVDCLQSDTLCIEWKRIAGYSFMHLVNILAELHKQVHPPKKYQPKRLIPIYTEECKEPLKDAARQLNNRIMSVFNENSGVEDIWTELKTGLSQALTEHVRHKQTKSKPSHPWVDHGTKKLIQRRNRIHKRWKKCGDEDLKQEFKLLKRQGLSRKACAAFTGDM